MSAGMPMSLKLLRCLFSAQQRATRGYRCRRRKKGGLGGCPLVVPGQLVYYVAMHWEVLIAALLSVIAGWLTPSPIKKKRK